jgi:hypothetical protein
VTARRRYRVGAAAIAGALVLAVAGRATGVVQQCSDPSCASVAVDGPAEPAAAGDTVLVRLAFAQGADDGHAGGADEIAAISVTVGFPGLMLADCGPPASNGLNPSFITLPNAAGRYTAAIENLTCARRASCLCPTGGEPRDAYANVVLAGVPNGGVIPRLPGGELLAVALRVPNGIGAAVPLHLYAASDDPEQIALPSGAGRLSIADTGAIDRTLNAAQTALAVHLRDGVVTIAAVGTATPAATATATATVTAPVPTVTATASATAADTATSTPRSTATATAATVCVGDCDANGVVTVNELITGVGIALESVPISACPPFDCSHRGRADIACLIAAVDAALHGCSAVSTPHGTPTPGG